MVNRYFSNDRLGTYLTLLLLSILFLVACSKPSATPTQVEPIRPGDKINGVLVTTGTEESIPMFDLPCSQKDNIYICTTTLGVPTNIATGIYGFSSEERESKWETLVYTMTIEGQPVDLDAFGTVDYVHQQTGLFMRAYNVVLISTDPISITTSDGGRVEDETFNADTLIVFQPPVADDPTQPLSTAAERLGQHPYTTQQTNFDLLLYLPGDYGKDTQVTWPLILFLHGGPNVTTLDWIRTEPLADQLDNQQEFPFIVASPLHTGEYDHWSQPAVMDELLTLLTELQSIFKINPQQIYLAGFLEGANGVWELGLAHPDKFTALVPASGYTGYPFKVPNNICALKDMPIWAFHGADETLIPPSAQQMIVDALNACGSDSIKFTIYPDTGDNAFFTAFADPNLYTWMLEQNK